MNCTIYSNILKKRFKVSLCVMWHSPFSHLILCHHCAHQKNKNILYIRIDHVISS